MASSKDLQVIQLKPQQATSESFQQFGQVSLKPFPSLDMLGNMPWSSGQEWQHMG